MRAPKPVAIGALPPSLACTQSPARALSRAHSRVFAFHHPRSPPRSTCSGTSVIQPSILFCSDATVSLSFSRTGGSCRRQEPWRALGGKECSRLLRSRRRERETGEPPIGLQISNRRNYESNNNNDDVVLLLLFRCWLLRSQGSRTSLTHSLAHSLVEGRRVTGRRNPSASRATMNERIGDYVRCVG